MAFTYNDPVIFLEYAIDVADAPRARDPHGRGHRRLRDPAPRPELYEHIDAANVDLKAFTDDFYEKSRSRHLDPVLDTLEYLSDRPASGSRSPRC